MMLGTVILLLLALLILISQRSLLGDLWRGSLGRPQKTIMVMLQGPWALLSLSLKRGPGYRAPLKR